MSVEEWEREHGIRPVIEIDDGDDTQHRPKDGASRRYARLNDVCRGLTTRITGRIASFHRPVYRGPS